MKDSYYARRSPDGEHEISLVVPEGADFNEVAINSKILTSSGADRLFDPVINNSGDYAWFLKGTKDDLGFGDGEIIFNGSKIHQAKSITDLAISELSVAWIEKDKDKLGSYSIWTYDISTGSKYNLGIKSKPISICLRDKDVSLISINSDNSSTEIISIQANGQIQRREYQESSVIKLNVSDGDNSAYASISGSDAGRMLMNSLLNLFHYSSEEHGKISNLMGYAGWSLSYRLEALNLLSENINSTILSDKATQLALNLFGSVESDGSLPSRRYSLDKSKSESFKVHSAKVLSALLRSPLNDNASYVNLYSQLIQKAVRFFDLAEADWLDELSIYRFSNSMNFKFDGIPMPWNMQAEMGQLCLSLYEATGIEKYRNRAVTLHNAIKNELVDGLKNIPSNYWPGVVYEGWHTGAFESLNASEKRRSIPKPDDTSHISLVLDFDRQIHRQLGKSRLFDESALWDISHNQGLNFTSNFTRGISSIDYFPRFPLADGFSSVIPLLSVNSPHYAEAYAEAFTTLMSSNAPVEIQVDIIDPYTLKLGSKISLQSVNEIIQWASSSLNSSLVLWGNDEERKEQFDGVIAVGNSLDQMEIFDDMIESGWEKYYGSDFNQDGFINGGTNYQLASDYGPVTLAYRGKTYSDSTTNLWDAKIAIQTPNGFKVLLDGDRSLENKYYVWDTDTTGNINKSSGWKTTTQAVASGWENTFESDINSDGLISGGKSYQLASDQGAVVLSTSKGTTYNDASTSKWDAQAATQTETGFQVLLDGDTVHEGKKYTWTTDSTGTITKGSGWITDAQAVNNGWENTFESDINSDGLISGGKSYQLASDQGAVVLSTSKGTTYNDASTSKWDAQAATQTETGFQVLLDGDTVHEGKKYTWTTDSTGTITKGSGWITDAQAVNNGWENTFESDINSDGLISGGKSYQLASDQGAVVLSTSKGTTYNDASTSKWDAQAATQTETGFQVLLDGDTVHEGKKYTWTTDSTGTITKGSGWITDAQAVNNGWENTFESDINSDGLISGGKSYQLASDQGAVVLSTSKGTIYNDASTSKWDAQAATQTETGFQVLLDGDTVHEGKKYTWTTDSTGTITKGSGWITDAQAVNNGWENTFESDINSDGLISGGKSYQLASDQGAVVLSTSKGTTYNDASTSKWDAQAATQTETGFQVLLDGDTVHEGKKYTWTTDSTGTITKGSGWITDAQAVNNGWENTFESDINSDGLISGGKSYQLASDQGAVVLSTSKGTTYNDASTSKWDAQAATQTETGFQVLLDGDTVHEGKKYTWTTDSTGTITKGSGWITDAQAVNNGWENTFESDINSDGLISGGISYQLASDQGAVVLRTSKGTTYNDASTSIWDAQAATQTNTGFQVLLDGDTVHEGKKYTWTTDSTGTITKGSGWITDAQAVNNGWENTFESDINSDGLISGGKSYQLASDQGAVVLSTSKGTTYNDASTSKWDAQAATQTETGFQVLLDGDTVHEGKKYTWTTDSTGTITKGSGWITDAQAVNNGWENTFESDINSDGLISGGKSYQLASDQGAVVLSTSKGTTYNDASTSKWDAQAATQTETGFQVLLDGDTVHEGKKYTWTTDSTGTITKGSGWITDAQAVNNGWENTFESDINSDGLISGGKSYQLASDQGAVVLSTSKGTTYNDASTSKWDAQAATQTETGFQVLLDGDTVHEGKKYTWTTDSTGTITKGSGWITDAQAVNNGWEELFGVDINNNGNIDFRV